MTAPAIVSRETSVLRPQPTMVGWGLSVQIPEDVHDIACLIYELL